MPLLTNMRVTAKTMTEAELLTTKPYCYKCKSEENVSIRTRRARSVQFMCRDCRNAYSNKVTSPVSREQRLGKGWSEEWLSKSQESLQRIAVKYG